MILRLKDMIERCFGRARRGECATCDHRERCAVARWQHGFAFAGAAAPAARPESPPTRPAPFLAFLGEMAGAVRRGLADRTPPLRSEIEGRLEALLPDGDVGIDRVAREMGLSRQTLYRRLKAEGATYEQVLDGLRHRLALRFIKRDGISAKEAAYRLGFSEPAAFSRAFKRWTGSSPSALRGTE
ncbi:MAG: araC family transcriptional regulator [Alphaproteobacteria bacterium]|nr:araC family transcriptional regulator [Alphaproteobacteria bacterium]